MGRSKRLLRTTAIYFVGDVSTKLLSFLFIPLYTAYIASKDYGYFDYVSTWVTIILAFAFQSIPEALFRFTMERLGKKESKDEVFGTVLFYVAGLVVFYASVICIIGFFVTIPYLAFILLYSVLQLCVTIWQYSARALGENTTFMASSVLSTATSIGANLWMILVLHLGIESLFAANILSRFILIVVIESRVRIIRHARFSNFNKALLGQMLKYSFPLAINAVSIFLLTTVNRIIVTNQMGAESNGILAISIRISFTTTLFTNVFLMAWSEEAYREYSSNDSIQHFKSIVDFFIRITYASVLLMLPFFRIVFKYIVFGDYQEGLNLLPWAFLSAIVIAQASQLGSLFNAMKRTRPLMTTTVISGLTSAALCLLLIKPFGLYAAVWSTCIGGGIMFFLRLLILRKWIHLDLEWKPILMNLLMFGAVTFVFLKAGIWVNLLCMAVVMVLQVLMNRTQLKVLLMRFRSRGKEAGS